MNADRSTSMLKAMTAAALAGCLVAPAALAQQRTDLSTRSGHDVGVTLTNYKYSEPGVMAIKARKIGFDYSITHAIGSEWPNRNNGWFVRADLRYATGKGDYSSSISGSLNDRVDWYYEVRGLIGKDYDQGSYVLSPYAGLGFRHLYNDLRGVTNTGAVGYRRESNYTTLPIGVMHRMALSNQSQLHSTVEYLRGCYWIGRRGRAVKSRESVPGTVFSRVLGRSANGVEPARGAAFRALVAVVTRS